LGTKYMAKKMGRGRSKGSETKRFGGTCRRPPSGGRAARTKKESTLPRGKKKKEEGGGGRSMLRRGSGKHADEPQPRLKKVRESIVLGGRGGRVQWLKKRGGEKTPKGWALTSIRENPGEKES